MDLGYRRGAKGGFAQLLSGVLLGLPQYGGNIAPESIKLPFRGFKLELPMGNIMVYRDQRFDFKACRKSLKADHLTALSSLYLAPGPKAPVASP